MKQLKAPVVDFAAGLNAVVSDPREGGDPRLLALGSAAVRNVDEAHGIATLGADGKVKPGLLPSGLGSGLPEITTDDEGRYLAIVEGVPVWVDLDGVTVAADTISPNDFDGAAHEKLAAAFAAGIAQGLPVNLRETYSIAEAVAPVSYTSGSLTVLGSGEVLVTANVANPLTFVAPHSTPVAISAIQSTTYTFPGGAAASDVTKITAAAHGVTAGDLVKIYCNDEIAGASATADPATLRRRLGEFHYVAEVISSNEFYVSGRLREIPVTAATPRMVIVRRSRFQWVGPGVRATPGNSWSVNLVTIRGFMRPKFVASLSDGYSAGLTISSCYQAQADVDLTNFRNLISSASSTGYGVQDTCSHQSDVTIRALNVRHAYTTITNSATTADEAYKHGSTFGSTVRGSASGCSASAFDIHPEAREIRVEAVSVSDGIFGENSNGAAVQLRGRGNAATGRARNTQHGAQFWAQAENDGVNLTLNDWHYKGDGDAVRFGAESTGIKLRRPRVKGGYFSCGDNFRTVYITQTDFARLSEFEASPTGTATASLITIGANVDEVWLVGIELDLTDFAGANYDFIAFSGGASGTRVRLVAPSVIDPNGKLRSWVNGSDATGVTVDLMGLPDGVDPSGGTAINATGLTVATRTSTLTQADLIALIEAAPDPDGSSIGEALIDAITAADPDAFASQDRTLAHIEAAADDSMTDGPRLGGAIAEALATMSEANLLLMHQAIMFRLGRKMLMEPGSGVAEGDILMAGPTFPGSPNLRGVASLAPSVATPPANSFPHVDATSRIEYLSAAAFADLIDDHIAGTGGSLSDLLDAAASDPDVAEGVGGQLVDLIEASDPDAFSSLDRTLLHLEEAADDAVTDGPRFGSAVSGAFGTMSEANLLLMLQTIMNRLGRKMLIEPGSGVATGDILVAGPTLDGSANLRAVTSMAPAVVTPPANSFPRVNASSQIEYLGANDFADLLDPYITGGGGSLSDMLDAAAGDPEVAEGVGGQLVDLIETSDPNAFSSQERTIQHIEEAAEDAVTAGPRLGGAISETLATLSEADLTLMHQSQMSRMGKRLLLEPGSGISEGDILVAGATLVGSPNLRSVGAVSPVVITPAANSFPHVNASSVLEYLGADAAIALLEAGLPFASTAVTPVSNVLSYDAYANRRAYLGSALGANLMLNPNIWNAVVGRMWDAELTIPVGGTNRTLDVGAVLGTQLFPSDGLIPQLGDGITLPFTLPANSIVSFGIGRRMGGVPLLRLLSIGYSAVSPVVAYVGIATPNLGTLGTRTITAAQMPAHQAGDLIMCFAYNSGGGTSPAMTGYAPVAGIGGDGITGGILVATKVAASNAESPVATGATQLHCIVFRKANGTPQVQATVAFSRGAYSDTTSTWPSLTVTNKGIVVALHGLISTDDIGAGPAVRTEVGNPLYAPTGNNKIFIGVSPTIAAGDTLPSATTPKSGGVGRAFTAQIAIY